MTVEFECWLGLGKSKGQLLNCTFNVRRRHEKQL